MQRRETVWAHPKPSSPATFVAKYSPGRTTSGNTSKLTQGVGPAEGYNCKDVAKLKSQLLQAASFLQPVWKTIWEFSNSGTPYEESHWESIKTETNT